MGEPLRKKGSLSMNFQRTIHVIRQIFKSLWAANETTKTSFTVINL